MIAIGKKNFVTHLLTAFVWLVNGLVNFALSEDVVLQMACGYLFMLIALVFFISTLSITYGSLMDRRAKRYSTTLE
jgi:uncharacterized membrane protein YhaH (DUF805 family)